MRAGLVFLLAIGIAGAEEWTRFRGPNGSGIARGTGYPVELGPEKNLVWRATVRPGKSSPVLTKTRVFLTGFEDGQLYTQAFDRATGKLLWERSEPRKRDDGVQALNHPAAISPVTDGENVYVFFKDFGLLSYDAAGKQRWRVPVDPAANTQGLGASPILVGDLLILQVDQVEGSYLAAYSKSNGELRWKASREERDGWATPIVYQRAGGPAQIVTAGSGQLGLYRVADGKRLGSYRELSPAMVASPVLDGETILAFGYGAARQRTWEELLAKQDTNKDGKLNRGEYKETDNVLGSVARYLGNRDGEITADEWEQWRQGILGATGLVAVRFEGDAKLVWRVEKGFEGVIPTPLLYEGILYVVKNGGILTAYDVKSGQLLKAARITGALGGYSASPTAAGGSLYFASEEGKISVVRPGREWEVVRVNDLDDPFFGTPAMSEGRIFARGSRFLYCFGGR